MAVPFVIKGTLDFNLASHGWSESFFWQSNDGDLHIHAANLLTIAQKRAKLLGKEAAIQATRVSIETDDDGKPRLGDSLLTYVSLVTDVDESCDEPDVCLLVTWRNLVAQRRKNQFLRGIWDSIDVQGGRFDSGNAAFSARFNSWANSMLTLGVGWIALDKQPAKAINNYSVDDATNQVTVTMQVATFGAAPYSQQKVRIQGVNGKSVLNGIQIVLPVSTLDAIIVKPIAVTPYVSGGKLSLYLSHFERAVDIVPQKITRRAVGAPLLQSRGRARARVRT